MRVFIGSVIGVGLFFLPGRGDGFYNNFTVFGMGAGSHMGINLLVCVYVLTSMFKDQ